MEQRIHFGIALVTLVSVLGVLAGASPGRAGTPEFVCVDVDNYGIPEFYDNANNDDYGQTFVPTDDSFAGVGLYVGEIHGPLNGPADLVLYEVLPGDALAEVGRTAFLETGDSLVGPIDIFFNAPLLITAGAEYFFAIVVDTGLYGIGIFEPPGAPDTYPGGEEAWTLDGTSVTRHFNKRDLSFRTYTCAFDAEINIKPGSDPNSINLCSGGATPITVWGSSTLDVATIDTNQLVFASASTKTVGKSDRTLCSIEDVGQPDTGSFDKIDPTPDGYLDLTCHFVTIEMTDLDDTSTEGELSITGCDAGMECQPGDPGYYEGSVTDAVNIVKDC